MVTVERERKTTVQMVESVWKRLQAERRIGETLSDVVKRLLDEREAREGHPE